MTIENLETALVEQISAAKEYPRSVVELSIDAGEALLLSLLKLDTLQEFIQNLGIQEPILTAREKSIYNSLRAIIHSGE